MMTQKAMIFNHLKQYGSITPLDALNLYGCMRLGARIYDLKAAGNDIRMTMETRTNASGTVKRYARYWMPQVST